MLTNHHIALGSLQRLSTPEKDLVKDGFVALTRDEEMKVPGMTLNVLQEIEDVTARVNGALKPGMAAAEAVAARQQQVEAIQEESLKATGMQSQVVSLYAGAVYNLYRYKTYSDVRLVFGAEYQTGFYGGDPDNFTYPRHNLDLGMFRLYENDKPASTPNHLRWSPAGSKDGELVFTTGHPGATQRLNTFAHVQYRRDVALPFSIARGAMREAAIKKWAALGPENERQTKSELFGVQNSLKNQRYQLKGLQDAALMAKKEAEEKRLREGLAKNPQKQQELGDAWQLIEQSLQAARQLDAERSFIADASGLNSQLFTLARGLVRPAYAPAGAADESRGPRRGGPAAGAQRPGGGDPPINLEREKLNLTESLTFMVEQLGASHAITKRILGGATPAARAAELVDKTRLTDPEIRNLLRAGGRGAIDVSTDPFIVLARSLEPDAQAIAKEVRGAGHDGAGGGVPEDRPGGVRGLRPERLPRRDRHAAALLRHREELHGERQEGGALHHHRGTLRAGRAAREPAAVRPGAPLGRGEGGAQSEDSLQPRHHQRHRRRQQRIGDGQPEGRAGRVDLRREPADAARLLHLRGVGEPGGVGGLARHPRGAGEGLQGNRAGAGDQEVGPASVPAE